MTHPPERMPRIDVHPHFFNGYDLPVAGFIEHAIRPTKWSRVNRTLGRWVARYAATSPSLDADRAELDRAIGEGVPVSGIPVAPFTRWTPVGLLLALGRRVRMFREAHRSRLDLVRRLDGYAAGTSHSIHLYVPLSVDMESGAQEQARVSPLEQFDLLARISDASLRGTLGIDGIVLPMIAYDPRREPDNPRNDLAAVQRRVERGEAIGIKLYPPMGFLPIGNTEPAWDARLRALYEWCQREQVPITAHCSPANAVEGAKGNAASVKWRRVLDDFPGLHLNLAHTGGLEKSKWNTEAVAFVAEQLRLGRQVYADVSNHDLSRKRDVRRFLDQLFERIAAVTETRDAQAQVFSRLMYGSDYWFVTSRPRPKRFLKMYVSEVEQAICRHRHDVAELLPSFLGGAATRFLMLQDPASGNHRRVYGRLRRLDEPPGSLTLTESTRVVLDLDEAHPIHSRHTD